MLLHLVKHLVLPLLRCDVCSRRVLWRAERVRQARVGISGHCQMGLKYKADDSVALVTCASACMCWTDTLPGGRLAAAQLLQRSTRPAPTRCCTSSWRWAGGSPVVAAQHTACADAVLHKLLTERDLLRGT